MLVIASNSIELILCLESAADHTFSWCLEERVHHGDGAVGCELEEVLISKVVDCPALDIVGVKSGIVQEVGNVPEVDHLVRLELCMHIGESKVLYDSIKGLQ